MFKKNFLFFTWMIFSFHASYSAISFAEPIKESKYEMKIKLGIECTHHFNRYAGSEQDCMEPSSLSLKVQSNYEKKASAYFEIDPLSSPSDQFEQSIDRNYLAKTKDNEIKLIHDYGFDWKARNNLSLKLGAHRGYVTPYNGSQLAKSGFLIESPWVQTALILNYNLQILDGFNLGIAFGNGEGELVSNIDAQQYVGIGIESSIGKSFLFKIGSSFDGNHTGSEEFNWQYQNYSDLEDIKKRKGFSTQRWLLSTMYQGSESPMRGLSVALSFQRTIQHDLDKNKQSVPLIADLEEDDVVQDPSFVMLEDLKSEVANTIYRDLILLGVSYKILDQIILGADYSFKQTKSKISSFSSCETIVNKKCGETSVPRDKIIQSGMGAGFNWIINEYLRLNLEYRQVMYDDLYAYLHYTDEKQNASKVREILFARLEFKD